MYRIFIFSITTLSFAFNQANDTSTEYIIYTSENFKDSAEILRDFYNNPYDFGYTNTVPDISLNTKILTTNDVTPENFNTYIFNNFSNSNGIFENLKYLLIIGDENIIEPIKYYNIAASDDYFSSQITSTFTFPVPTLKTGRLIVQNSYECNTIINNIVNYVTNPSNGDWKSQSLFIADDLFKSGKEIHEEILHTQYSDILYNRLKKNMNITCLYGNDYSRNQSSDWYIQPELNNKIIQKINNGLSLVNYIGHGTSSILADEDILTIADVNLLSIENNKLPIWIVGTCSFGNYLNENCFSEELLKKGNAAIAVISTSYNISYNSNWTFIDNFYSNLEDYLENNNNFNRLGDIFFNSKTLTGNNAGIDYKFHLFGDPAMPIKIAKSVSNSNNIIEPINQIDIANFNTLNTNNNSLSTIKINLEDKAKTINYIDENNSPTSLSYNLPGEILFYDSFYESTEFILPLNININETATINIHNDNENKFQNISNISLILSNQNNFENINGPNILIEHKEKTISNNDTLYPPYNIRVIFEDQEPINLSGLNNNNLRIWLNNKENNSIILNDLFIPSQNQNGYSGYAELNLNNYFELNQKNNIKIQAWDILGKSNVLDINLNIYNNDLIYNVYNFPNPFNNETNFTFHYSESNNVDVKIEIHALNGKIVKTIEESNINPSNETFYKIQQTWNGNDENNNNLSNGTYIYKLTINNSFNNEIIHQGIYKITKIK